MKKLRQFIKSKMGKISSDASKSGIVSHFEHRPRRLVQVCKFCLAVFSIDMHRAKLQHIERLFVQTQALLPE
jgi:hypothetical protein